MKKLLLITILLVSGTLSALPLSHPIKLTSSLIKYDKDKSTIGVECKVFIDDFSPSISEGLEKRVYKSNLTQEDLKAIERYFTANFKISINGKVLPWKIISYDVEKSANVLTLTFSKNSITLRIGDVIKIENTLLFESFGDIQSNWMTLRFPPFIRDDNFETNTFRHIYSKTLK